MLKSLCKFTIEQSVSLEDRLSIFQIDKCIIDTIYTNTDNLVLIINNSLVDSYELLNQDIENIIGSFNYNSINY